MDASLDLVHRRRTSRIKMSMPVLKLLQTDLRADSPPPNGWADDVRPTRRLRGLPPAYVEICRIADPLLAVSVLLGVFLLANIGNFPGGLAEFLAIRVTLKNAVLLLGFVIFWPVLFSFAGLYDSRLVRDRREEAVTATVAVSLGSVAALLMPLFSNAGTFSPILVVCFWAAAVPTTLLSRQLIRAATARATALQDVLIIGSGPRAYKLFRDIEGDVGCGYNMLGFVDSNDNVELDEIRDRLIGRLDELETILVATAVDEVLIALPVRSCYEQIEEVIQTCERIGVECKYLADMFENRVARPRYEPAGEVPVIALRMVQSDVRLMAKRLIDLVGATLGLVALAPLLLIIAGLIKMTSPGPVLFRQKRYGKNRRLFAMYKFRTMVAEAETLQITLEHLNEAQGPVFKIRDDPRVTWIGRFLRRTSLDEIPQLINVLRGEMSLVGPRPLPTRDVHRFTESSLMRRFSVLPGLTCLWQISGRSELGFDSWVALDLEYIDGWSLSLDFRILLRTLPAVIRGEGAS
jgi:exopolysaccharide biosynthesis polyprenyl glycosylphosphotransferase